MFFIMIFVSIFLLACVQQSELLFIAAGLLAIASAIQEFTWKYFKKRKD